MITKTNTLSNFFRRNQRINTALQSRWALVLPMLLAVWSVYSISVYMHLDKHTQHLYEGMVGVACGVSCVTLAMFRPQYWRGACCVVFLVGAMLFIR